MDDPERERGGEAFLYTRALDPTTSPLGRMLAAIAGLVTAIATMLVLAEQTHRMEVFRAFVHAHRRGRGASSIKRSDLLEDVEGAEIEELERRSEGKGLRGWAATRTAVTTWLAVLVAFAIIDTFTIGIAIAELCDWWHPLDED